MPLIPEQPQPLQVPVARRRTRVRVVCLGGGTGLSMILRGLKLIASVTAVVTTTDDGGSSGRLRRDFGMPAPGDVRHCLSALAEDESLVGQLFEHRFATGELAGHSFGNLFLAGLTDYLGSFDQAVSESARVLAVSGRVVPSTTDVVELVARFEDGRTVRGETAIAADGDTCDIIRLDPPDPRAHPRALQAIERADLIVMGPGSLFTSTLPPLLVPGIREAVRMARVPRIYVLNLLQQPGETARLQGVGSHRPDLRARRRRPRRRRPGQPQPGGARHPGSGRPRRPAAARRARVRARAWPASGSTTPTGWRGSWCSCPAGIPPMAFGEDVRHELVERPPRKACCRDAFLSGLIRGAGTLEVRGGGELAVVVELGDPAAVRAAFGLLRERGAECEILSFREHRFDRSSRLLLNIHGDRGLQTLHEIGVLSAALAPVDEPPRRLLGRACCRASYLRGAFVAGGSVAGAPPPRAPRAARRRRWRAPGCWPRSPGRDGLELRAMPRRNHAIAYTKRRETVRDLLAAMGAHDAVLSLDEAEVVSRTREQANRLTNCDRANLGRASAAAHRQRQAIERLDVDSLPPDLRQAAELRLRYPDGSLAELAASARAAAYKVSSRAADASTGAGCG